MVPLEIYIDWAGKTMEDARDAVMRQKLEFYEGFVKDPLFDMVDVARETIAVWNEDELGSPITDLSCSGNTTEEEVDSDAETSSSSSTSLYATANGDDEASTHSNDVVAAALHGLVSTRDINAILHSTGFAEISEVDRLLR